MPTPPVVTAYFRAACSLDAGAMAACFASGGEVVDPAAPGPIRGTLALKVFYGAIAGSFARLEIREEGVVAAGRFVAARFAGTATGASGKSAFFEGLDVFELDEQGRILRLTGFWDPAALMTAIG